MTIYAVIAGADDFVAIAHFANTKKEWFSKFLDMSSGVPSHDRFNSIFKHIKPDEFERCLLSWLTTLYEVTASQVIAIDGKTLRRSYDRKDGIAAINMVSAWTTENHISLWQAVVDAESNEISAIPKLLEMIKISGALVTIDAMGCQTEIAEQIITAKADYCLAVKGNQPTLHKGLQAFFMEHLENDFADVEVSRIEKGEKSHGRENQSRIRKGNADANFSTLRRNALSLLKQEKSAKSGVKNKRLKYGWDDGTFAKVLFSA